MKRIGWIGVATALVIAVGATGAALAQRTGAAAPAACTADARTTWRSGQTVFTVEAFSRGAACQRGASALVIRRSDGEPVWGDIFFNDRNFILQDADTPRKLRAALQDWIDQTPPLFASTEKLPPWDKTDGMPASEEFPFYPDEAYANPTAWEALRKRRAPLFCFVQGMESYGCLLYDSQSGMMEKIGAQSFPG